MLIGMDTEFISGPGEVTAALLQLGLVQYTHAPLLASNRTRTQKPTSSKSSHRNRKPAESSVDIGSLAPVISEATALLIDLRAKQNQGWLSGIEDLLVPLFTRQDVLFTGTYVCISFVRYVYDCWMIFSIAKVC